MTSGERRASLKIEQHVALSLNNLPYERDPFPAARYGTHRIRRLGTPLARVTNTANLWRFYFMESYFPTMQVALSRKLAEINEVHLHEQAGNGQASLLKN